MGKLFSPRYSRDQQTVRWLRKQLVQRDGLVCGICGKPIATAREITIDHIRPLSKGGSDKLTNLRLAHEPCNVRRGNEETT